MELWVQIWIARSGATSNLAIKHCILRIRYFMTYVAWRVYIFQVDQSVICVCKPAVPSYFWHIVLSFPWNVYVINCLAQTLHQQMNKLLFRGYNASALSTKSSLIEHCTSIIQVSCCIKRETFFL